MSPLTLTLIQSNLNWEDKIANLKMFEQKILDLKKSTHIIVLPEMFSTGFSMNPEKLAEQMDGSTIQWMKQIAAGKKIILTGSLIIEENGKYYNRMLWVLPNGQVGYYNKRHLFAYGEEDQHYTSGNQRLIASVNGWKLNLLVCYDLRFPVWSRQQFDTHHNFEYDVLIYVANWPEKRSVAWKTLLQARAIENQCYVVGVNRIGKDGHDVYYSGDSMVIDPLGDILYHKSHGDDIFTITLDKDHLQDIRDRFPFFRDADDFEIFI
jgi:Predicted amidohydrolase